MDRYADGAHLQDAYGVKGMTDELSSRDQLRLTALLINSKLTTYIELHNKLLNQQATIWSFVRNLLGFRVPFGDLYNEVADLDRSWHKLLEGVFSLSEKLANRLTQDEKDYLDCLTRYTAAVTEAVAILSKNQARLFEASKSLKRSTLTMAEVKEMTKRYETAVARYAEVGAELNRLNRIIF